jgi:S-adenosylmethionine:tRNA ribosyltransferase-isomerase
MRLDAFDYQLPPSLVAQHPLDDRSASRLMVVERASGRWEHMHFSDLPSLLDKGDALVLNRSRVMPARLVVYRAGGGRAELFVTRILDRKTFVGIGSPLRKLRPGDVVRGENDAFRCGILERIGEREVRAEVASPHSVTHVLEHFGHMPLPPYIQRPDTPEDRERYQTVFAEEDGSVAAPTAGLHFDTPLLDAIRDKGIDVCSLVLHVGLGTFLPLDRDVVTDNRLHAESYTVGGETLEALHRARRSGGRVVAVGTTVTRVLETLFESAVLEASDPPAPCSGDTDIFIYPGYEYGYVDALVTNFHLPRSSLLLLVCAFLGTEKTLACYEEAVRQEYRFYSYGDAMFIR